MPRARKPTLPDVAREAGVSRATAGRVLGRYGYASSEVAERVLAAAERLGYRPNAVARALVTRRSHTIGVIGADIENAFFARAMRGISDVAEERGFDVLLTNSDERVDKERAAIRTLVAKQVDGIVLAPASSQASEHLVEIVASGTPVVLFDRAVAGLAADAVVVDNTASAQAATEHLLGLGHDRIAIVTELGDRATEPERRAWFRHLLANQDEATSWLPGTSRLLGYLLAHRAAGVPVQPELVRLCRYDRQAAAEETRRAVLDLGATALFAVDSLMMLGAFEAVVGAKLEVPRQVSLVGFDDLDWTALVTPPLTVVAQPVYELGAVAARQLVERIEGLTGPPRTTVLPTHLVHRQSTGTPPPRGATGTPPPRDATAPPRSAAPRTVRVPDSASAAPTPSSPHSTSAAPAGAASPPANGSHAGTEARAMPARRARRG